jgi:molybdopterin molybdotransferase
MKIDIQITSQLIVPMPFGAEFRGAAGTEAEFAGVVRDAEDGKTISALDYEAYSPMAENQIHRILESLSERFPCLAARVIHRIGSIPVGETAIYVCIASKHRGEAFAMLAEFMNRLKQDVPIWKRGARNADVRHDAITTVKANEPGRRPALRSLDEALTDISARVHPLPGVRAPLTESLGRVLCEAVLADEDLPPADKSTRDGYAILADDRSEVFHIVDAIHAADWKPRQMKAGEAVRIATGGSLPADGLRVVMQEHVERDGDRIKVVRREPSLNIRKRGEEMRAGQPVLGAGTVLNAGALAMLATVGCVEPLVSPKLRVAHFTTGDEIVSPDKKPAAGQIRDSNSILVRALLQSFPCDLTQMHLQEDFEQARKQISAFSIQPSAFDVILISGGASVGDKDFTRPLLEWLGFEIVFNRVNLRPGAPLIFGVADKKEERLAGASPSPKASAWQAPDQSRVAFGLPGNPLSHFVCYQVFVVAALRRLIGAGLRGFSRGRLASKLEDVANPRETLWPAQSEEADGGWSLTPLPWSSSGDVTSLVKADALIRVPANAGSIAAGGAVEFLPAR